MKKEFSAFAILPIVILTQLQLNALTLKSALHETIQTNPSIQAKYKELEAARHELELAKSGYYPKIDIQTSYGYEQAKSQLTNQEKKNWDSWNTSATMSQNLFAGFSTRYDIATKEKKIKAREYALLEQANDSALQLCKSYLDLLRAYELLLIEADNVKKHEKIFNDIKARTEGGSGRISDFMEVSAKLSLAYSNLLAQDNNYHDSMANFHKSIGRFEEGKNLERPDDVNHLPQKLEDSLNEALKSNPSLLVSRYEIEAAKTAMMLERHNYMPKVDAALNAKTSENASGMSGKNESASALLTMSWNLYNGGSDTARVERAISEIENNNEKLHVLEREVMEGMALSFNAYSSLNRQKEFLAIYEESNLQKKGYYQEEFDLGRRSLIDLLDAEDEYNTARRKVAQNRYDRLYAQYRILDAKGGLLEHFGLRANGDEKKVYSHELDEVEQDHPVVLCQNNVNATFGINGCQLIPQPQKYNFIDSKSQLVLSTSSETNSSLESNTTIAAKPQAETITIYDPEQAFEWYLKAANQGSKEAMKALSVMYRDGVGVSRDSAKEIFWKNLMKKDTLQRDQNGTKSVCGDHPGYSEAMGYLDTNSTNEDKLKAFHLLADAARSGDVKSQFALARMYNQGQGIGIDKDKAAYWYRESARNGYAPAYLIVWSFYRDGKGGVVQDTKQAEYWRLKALEARKNNYEPHLECKPAQVTHPEVKMCDQECEALLAEAKKHSVAESKNIYEKASMSGSAEASFVLANSYYPIEKLLESKSKITPKADIPVLKPKTAPQPKKKELEGVKSLEERLRDLGISLNKESMFLGTPLILNPPPPLKNKNDIESPRK